MKENYPKAYTEVLEILKYMPKDDVNKIPKELVNTFEYKKDNNYIFAINEYQDFSKLKVLNETKAIMVNIFRDYWASPEQKEKIKTKQQHDMRIIEEEKRQNYNPNNIFKNKEIKSIENPTSDIVSMIEYKESAFKRFLDKVKRIFVKK